MTGALSPRSLAATILFAIAVLLSCSARPGAAQEMAPGGALVLEGTLSEYFIYLPQAGSTTGTVRFVVQNTGEEPHNLRVVGNGVDRATRDLRAGEAGEVEVVFSESGPFTVYCDIGDHADRGMTTGFYVEAPFTGA